MWAKGCQSSGLTQGKRITTDQKGNVYATGVFSNSITIGTYSFTSAGSYDCFLSKYNSNGVLQWATTVSGSDGDYGYDVATDKYGNVIIVGEIFAASSINGTNLNYFGGSDIFIAKFSSNGNLIWSKTFGGPYRESAYGVSCDQNANIIITGTYHSSPFNMGSFVHYSSGLYDVFTSKLDSDGNVLWSQTINGPIDDWATDVVTDMNNNVYVTGYYFSNQLMCASIVLNNLSGDYDSFVTKYNSNGNVQWAKTIGGVADDRARAITVDHASNIYVVGTTASASMSTGSLNANTTSGGFLLKFNSSGNGIFMKGLGGSGDDITCDAMGSIYITGLFTKPSTSFGAITLYNSGQPSTSDLYVLKCNNSGMEVWATSAHGKLQEYSYGIAKDLDKGIYIIGGAGSPTVFGNDTLTCTLYSEIFIAKLRDTAFLQTFISENNILTDFNFYPNPSDGKFLVQGSFQPEKFRIYDILGNPVGEESREVRISEIDLTSYTPGIYFVEFYYKGEKITRKLIRH